MSTKSKTKARLKRAAEKRARKASMQARYEAWREAGQNSKSKRSRLASSRAVRHRNVSHPEGPCGNVGCKRCNPAAYNMSRPGKK